MGRAVGIDEDGVGDVLHDGRAGERLGRPAGDGLEEGGGRVLRAVGGDGEGLVGEDPEGVFGGGIGGGRALLGPVDGGEDDEWCAPLRSIQSRPRAGQKWTTQPEMEM